MRLRILLFLAVGFVGFAQVAMPRALAQVPRQRAAFKDDYLAAFSPDGKILAVADFYGTVTFLEIDSGKKTVRLNKAHPEGLFSLAFTPDGKKLITGGDKVIKVWEVATGKALATLKGLTGMVVALAVSADGTTLASGGNGCLNLWDLATGKERPPLPGKADWVNALAWTPDGKTLATAPSLGEEIKLYDVASARVKNTFPGHQTLAITADGKTLVAAAEDRTVVNLWDVATGKVRATLTGHTEQVRGVAITPDGKTVASIDVRSVLRVWDGATGKERGALRAPAFVQQLVFSPDGKRLAGGAGNNTVFLWDMVPGTLPPLPSLLKERITLPHETSVYCVAFIGDGMLLASGGGDEAPAKRGVTLWNPVTGKPVAFIKSSIGPVMRLAASADGKMLAWAHEQGAVVRVWDLARARLKGNFNEGGGRARAIAFAPDGTKLATGNESGVITLWDLATGKPAATLAGHQQSIRALAFTPDGKQLASSSHDETVKLWEVSSGKETAVLRGTGSATGMTFSRDGKLLATAAKGDREVILWDMETRKEKGRFGPLRYSCYSTALTPDGKTVAATDGTEIHLWEVATGKEVATMDRHGNTVWCLAFSPDGRLLASAGSGDRTVRLWDVPVGK
jgi:WD40 repeat protein